MRIAMISEHASPLAAVGGVDAGGQNVHVAELAAALARRGHDIRVYTRRDDPAVDEAVPVDVDGASGRVWVVHVPAGPAEPIGKDDLLAHMTDFGGWMRRRWRRDGWQPDVVHAHFWMSGLAAHTAIGRLPVPLVVTYHALGVVKRRHQGEADTSPPQRQRLERWLGSRAASIVAQCSDEVFELKRLGVPGHRIAVVPSGVNVATFTPDGPAAPTGRLPRVLAVGRLVPRKGFDVLVGALPRLPGTELAIAGGTPDRPVTDEPEGRRLLALAERLGVADRVRMLGAVPAGRMPALYRSAQLLAATPWYEPFGMTPLEAMACGLPVVATAVGGLTDSVVDGATGLLVPPRDPSATATAIGRLLDDPARRRRYGRAAAAKVRTRYRWDRIAAEVATVYRQARTPAADLRRAAR